jgi:quaternary ammonium compound-resistance protein SugE
LYWIYILIAAAFEISWAVGLKYSNGFTNLKASIFTVITMVLSYIFLSLGVKGLPIGTAYAVWTGIGAVGTALYGILFFNESKEVLRILFLLLIVAGIIGLKFTSK